MARRVRTGLEVLLGRPAPVQGLRIGLVANPASITSQLVPAALALARLRGVNLVALFGPEHGITADAQDLVEVDHSREGATGLPVHSLYGETRVPTPQMLAGLDAIVVDLQDVGSRYYTYVYTMAHAMEVAARVGVPVVVCDRPNPIGGVEVEGNVVQDGFRSFVGRFPLPNRHGMTAGELAVFFNGRFGWQCELEVVGMRGWSRALAYVDTGLPWVQPSPNMPTCDTALVYPGMCFFEGTLLSEGRGCTRPFEIVGAPFVDGSAWAEATSAELSAAGYGGFAIRPLTFQPTFHKHGGEACGGIQLHITDPLTFRPVMVATALMKSAWRLWPEASRWRTERYEYVQEPIAIDLLGGSEALRLEVEGDCPLPEIQERWDRESAEFLVARRSCLLYE